MIFRLLDIGLLRALGTLRKQYGTVYPAAFGPVGVASLNYGRRPGSGMGIAEREPGRIAQVTRGFDTVAETGFGMEGQLYVSRCGAGLLAGHAKGLPGRGEWCR